MKWVKVEHEMPSETKHVLAFANDVVNSWMVVVNAYVCPEYGNVIFEELNGEDYPAIITHWAELPLNPLELDLGNADSDDDFLERNPWLTKNSDFIN